MTNQIASRSGDIALLKTLGMKFSDINKMIIFEFLFLIASAFVVGLMLSLSSSYIISANIFDGSWGINFSNIGVIFCILFIFSLIIIKVALNKIMKNNISVYL